MYKAPLYRKNTPLNLSRSTPFLVEEYTNICWGVHQHLLGSTPTFAGEYTNICWGVHRPLSGSTLTFAGKYTVSYDR
jgi:hypothetical protein